MVIQNKPRSAFSSLHYKLQTKPNLCSRVPQEVMMNLNAKPEGRGDAQDSQHAGMQITQSLSGRMPHSGYNCLRHIKRVSDRMVLQYQPGFQGNQCISSERQWLFRIMSSQASSSMSNAEASSTASSSTPTPTLKRYEAVLADELKLQTAQYPTTEEVPGCMTLL